MKAFVDVLKEDGQWSQGQIAWPYDEALNVAAEIREQHPDWVVEVNPLEAAP